VARDAVRLRLGSCRRQVAIQDIADRAAQRDRAHLHSRERQQQHECRNRDAQRDACAVRTQLLAHAPDRLRHDSDRRELQAVQPWGMLD
jgi:hypothetical protein